MIQKGTRVRILEIPGVLGTCAGCLGTVVDLPVNRHGAWSVHCDVHGMWSLFERNMEEIGKEGAEKKLLDFCKKLEAGT